MHDFGATRELWNAYVTAFSHHWSHGNDPRMLLVAEAGERVDQLAELVLLLEPELRTLRGDPAANRQNREEWLKLYSRYAQGTLSDEEYRALLARLPVTFSSLSLSAWRRVRLFTECFYMVAWRLREILNASGPLALPGFHRFDPKGVRNVRNLLIQHPEDAKGLANYSQTLMLTDDGPVLKSNAAILGGVGGRVTAVPDSTDQGLVVNARELGELLETHLRAALGQAASAPA